jgi:hypothetical protein
MQKLKESAGVLTWQQLLKEKSKAAVRKMLVKHGIYYFMPPGMGLGRSGIPDIIGCHNGKFIAIECKAGKGKTTRCKTASLPRLLSQAGSRSWPGKQTWKNWKRSYSHGSTENRGMEKSAGPLERKCKAPAKSCVTTSHT